MVGIIGRGSELSVLEGALRDAEGGSGRTLVVSGEAGVGKTALVEEFLASSARSSPLILSGAALQESGQPFHIFSKALAPVARKPIFEEHEYRTFTALFAITRSGLLVAQASPEGQDLDADIFAGMFSAVQDFVRDSFDRGGGSGGTLGRLEYGDMTILIEHGRGFFLVAVFKGDEQREMRAGIQASVGEIDSRYGATLENWSGNTADVEGVSRELASLAGARFLVRKSLEGVNLEQERTRIADEALDLLTRESAVRPVVLLLEDLQWADESSLFVLGYIARNIGKSRILVLGTLRAEEGERAMKGLAPLIEDGTVSHLSLRGLDGDSTAELVEKLYPGHRFPREFIEKLAGQCEGNPFFASELLREMEATGAIFLRDGAPALEEHDIALPSSIAEVVQKRIECLDQDSLSLAEFASCAGREFDPGVLGKLRLGIGTDEALGRLREAGIVSLDGTKFSHALFHSVIYGGLSGRWKSHHHRAIGGYFEEAYRNRLDDVVYELARHFSMTPEHAKKFEYCKRAGEKAEGSYSPDLAIGYYQKALEALPRLRLPDAPDHAVELHERIGEIQGLRGSFEESLKNYQASLDAARDDLTKAKLRRKRATVMTWHGKFAEGLQELDIAQKMLEGKEHGEMGFLLVARAFINLNTGNFDDTMSLARDGIARLEGAKERDARKTAGRAWKILGACHMLKGDHDKAIECHEMGKRIGEEINDPYGLSAAYINLGNVYFAKGEHSKALEHYEIAMELFEKTKDLQGMSYTLNNIGVIQKNRGEFGKALEKYRECLRVLEKIGDTSGMASTLNNIGNLLSEQGDDKAAIEPYERAIALSRRSGDKQQLLGNMCALIPSRLALGEVDKAEKECQEAYEVSKEIGAKRFEYWSLRNRGLLAALRGDAEAAVSDFTLAEAGFGEVNMDGELANTLLEHGAFLIKRGDGPGGREKIEKALEMFRKSGMNANAEKCETMLRGIPE